MQFSTMGTPATLKRLSYTAQAEEHLGILQKQIKEETKTSTGTGKQLSIHTCVMCSSATRSKVNLDSGWPVQVMLWPVSCLTHRLLPCSDTSLLLSGRTRMTTCGAGRIR
jgi:hypothetical protein